MNYLTIEHNKKRIERVVLADAALQDFLHMSYDEMKHSERLDKFTAAVTDVIGEAPNESSIVTLIDPNGVFIWSIMLGENKLINWKKDSKDYGYEG